MNELQKVDPKQFGLEETKAVEITSGLNQILEERSILEISYSEVILMEISKENLSKFRELRLKIRDNRTKGIQAWHKVNKEFYLRGGQFIDAIKNKEVEVNERMENALEENEKFFERQESERIEKLRQDRILECTPLSDFIPFGIDLGTLTDEGYNSILNGAKMQHESKIEADKKAESERLEKERIEQERIAEEKRVEAERVEAQKIENELLKSEAEAREKELQIQRKKDEAERKRIADLQAKKDADSAEKLRIEQEKNAKIAAELKAKQDAEKLAEQERLAKIEYDRKEAEKLAKAPVKKQMTTWVDSFCIAGIGSDKMDENQIQLANDILSKFSSFKKWAKSEIEKI